MLRCEQCGREFKNDLALKIHIGRQHGSKAKVKTAARTSLKCRFCGRSFRMPAHLARHIAASHGRGRLVKPARRGIPARTPARPRSAAGVQVAALTIDQLVDLKNAVDARLVTIAQQLRKAKIEV